MRLTRPVAVGVFLIVAGLAAAPAPLAARQSTPKLSRQQRATLEALVAAVEHAERDPSAAAPSEWQTHVLRASDGSHYVALRAQARGVAAAKNPVVLYVRLASHRLDGVTVTTPQRSAVLEWLKGMRGDPLPMRAARSMSLPQGEMPIGGAAAAAGDIASDSSSALRLMEHQRQRDIAEREERERKRRAELENAARTGAPVMHPFEDFDLAATVEADGSDTAVLRSVRAGPGDYDLTLAWAEPVSGNRAPEVHVVTRRLILPAATPAFALSDVVLADSVRTLDGAYPADRQNGHPYAIGALEATPARDDRFRVDERLSVMFQVINPAGAADGKPDVEIGFRVTRLVGDREEAVGTLPAQRHGAATLPVDFDVAKGHPLFAAVQASLARFARGRYKLTVTAVDHLAGQRAVAEALFTVVGTPHSLLNEAPSPGQAFRRDAVLTPEMMAAVTRAMAPAEPSPALARLFEAATAGRFAELLRDEGVAPGERPAAQTLRALGLLALGDTPRTVAPQLQQALAQGAPPPPVLLLLGAAHALANDDKAAITAWNQARDGGIDDALVATLLVDAYMRQGDVARATAMARAALDAQPGSVAAARGLAAARIAAGQYADALTVLDPLASATPDPDTDFLVVHALYGGYVGETAPGHTATGRDRLLAVGRRYVAAGGRHAALVTEWMGVVEARAASAPQER